MENTTEKRKMQLGIILVGIIILCIIAWYRIVQQDNSAPQITDSQAPATINQPQIPVLHADAPKLAGTVVMGPKTTTRFYIGRDGKRYVFPDETKTFDTWYPSGTKITRLSETELEKYPLGGNICYKPGTRLIHISSDTRVFAVSHGCVLRPINEGTAVMIFGADWQKSLDMLQDYYFTNYTIGKQISTTHDYSIAAEQGASQTIDIDKGL